MNRRAAIRNVLIVSAGMGILPSCLQDKKSDILLRHIVVTGSQEKMLAALSASIIPKTTNFIGAADCKAHEFVLTMVDDCRSPEDQQQFMNGMKAFDQLCHDRFGQLFTGFTAAQNKALLTSLEKKAGITPDADFFYTTVKAYTLQCFTSSKQYMTDVKHYKMVPGPSFKGCVPV